MKVRNRARIEGYLISSRVDAISQYYLFESIMDTTETEFSLKSREALPTEHMVPRWTDAIPDCLAAYFY